MDAQSQSTAEALDLLKSQVEEWRLRAELATLREDLRIRELSASVVPMRSVESGYSPEFVSRYGHGHYNFAGMNRDVPATAFASGEHPRQFGEFGPFIRSESDLRMLRDLSRWMIEVNPYLTGLYRALTNYVVGTGFVHRVTSSVGASDVTRRRVEAWIDEFLELNDWDGDRDRETFLREHRDGQAFTRIFPQDDGEFSLIRFIEPEYLGEPSDASRLNDWLSDFMPGEWEERQNWRFGIHTLERDVENPLGYFVDWCPGQRHSDWEYVPAREATYFKANTDRTVKPGLPDTFAIQGIATSVLGLLHSTLSGARAQARIAYFTQYEAGVTGEGVGRMVAGEQTRRDNRSRTEYLSSHDDAAEVRHIPEGRSIKHGPEGSAGTDRYILAIQAGLRCVGVRWCAPEFLVSGDASNANYASTLVAQSPFVLSVQADQYRFGKRMGAMIWNALRFAFAAGVFKGLPNAEDWRTFRRSLRVQPEGREIASEDSQNRMLETDRRLKLVAAGLMSDTTAAAEEGLEIAEQESEGAAHRDIDPETFTSVTESAATTSVTESAATRSARVRESAARVVRAGRQMAFQWSGYP